MKEYIRKVPYFNDYDKQKDFLKHPPVKENDNSYEQTKLRDKRNNIDYIIKKRQDIKEIFNYAPDANTKTQVDLIGERKTQLKDELKKNYDIYEKRHPFFLDTVVKKGEETKSMKDVLIDKYVPSGFERSRISQEAVTKSQLLVERKKLFLNELRQNNAEAEYPRPAINVSLHKKYDYKDVVKLKNRDLTFKNYGFWFDPTEFVFSYPHIQAKGKGGWATEIVKANILNTRALNLSKEQMNIENTEEDKKSREKKEEIFLMNNRFPFIEYSKKHCLAENYCEKKKFIVLRHSGFQKWTS